MNARHLSLPGGLLTDFARRTRHDGHLPKQSHREDGGAPPAFQCLLFRLHPVTLDPSAKDRIRCLKCPLEPVKQTVRVVKSSEKSRQSLLWGPV